MIPVFLPNPTIMTKVSVGTSVSVKGLCHQAGIECRVTGPSADRLVFLHDANEIEVTREPGNMGRVSIGLPRTDHHRQAVLALGVLAYSVFDYAARESVRGWDEMRPAPPHVRPKIPKPKTNAESRRARRSRKRCVAATLR
jgi:hypothetical protein